MPAPSAAGTPSGERPRVRVIRIATRGGAVALAAALGFGLAQAAPTADGPAAAAVADDAGTATPDDPGR